MYYLAKNPEVQKKARDEVNSVLGSLNIKTPDLEALRQMPYLTACIREALRLNTPITYIVPRSAVKSFELHGASKTYRIPQGASLIMNLTAVHHNSTYYPEPEKFNPDRFLHFSGAESLTWLPFASGPRQCPARNFAMYEMRTLVSMLLQRYDWTLPASSPHEKKIRNGFSPFALSLPKELQVELTRLDRLD
jgi:cytochrome P450